MSQMKSFFNVLPVSSALELLFSHIHHQNAYETIPTASSMGRIIAEAPRSPMDLPAFTRSTMDGFAVRAEDTFGASESLPAYLHVSGHIAMGEVPNITLEPHHAIEIHTGAMLPDGANAVVMVEHTQHFSDDEIEVHTPVAIGQNVLQTGEDIEKDSETLSTGHRLRPQDIGALLAVGINTLQVMKRPCIGIISCGDELVDAHEPVSMGQIRDINSHMLAALLADHPVETVLLGIARDTMDSMLAKAREGLKQCDMLVISAGSSVSARDLTHDVIGQLGKPGVIQHGLAVKPGKPTILAVCDDKPVLGLPGNPVSALMVARQIIVPTVRYLLHEKAPLQTHIRAKLQHKIASATGREDSVPVRLHQQDDSLFAEPILGKSNLIYTLLRADGIVRVPLDINGLTAGTDVEVIPF